MRSGSPKRRPSNDLHRAARTHDLGRALPSTLRLFRLPEAHFASNFGSASITLFWFWRLLARRLRSNWPVAGGCNVLWWPTPIQRDVHCSLTRTYPDRRQNPQHGFRGVYETQMPADVGYGTLTDRYVARRQLMYVGFAARMTVTQVERRKAADDLSRGTGLVPAGVRANPAFLDYKISRSRFARDWSPSHRPRTNKRKPPWLSPCGRGMTLKANTSKSTICRADARRRTKIFRKPC